MNKSKNMIWISWERHTRSISMASQLNAQLFEIISKGSRLKRYLICSIKTISTLMDTKPDVILFQNPSIVLALVIVVYKKFTGKVIIMDAHNAGIRPLEGRSVFLNFISDWIIRSTDLNIVTNKKLANKVDEIGGSSYVMTDPIPKHLAKHRSNRVCETESQVSRVTLVCTWAEDEPVLEVINAARLLGDNVLISITGKAPKNVLSMDIPNNVVLRGFLPEEEYISLLSSSDLIVDLTSRSSCLVCGAYEAAALGVPCLLSCDDSAREVFSLGYRFTSNDPESIADNIRYCLTSKPILREEIDRFYDIYSEGFLSKKIKLQGKIRAIINS